MAHNTYFKFKQFTIQQSNAAMKVGTDGVLLGSWTSVENVSSVLDVGTGTGIVALMLAQRSLATIDAVEIEENACADALLNFKNSPWENRLSLFNSSFQDFAHSSDQKFDCVVSNPPYFSQHTKSDCQKRSLARHSDNLPFEVFACGVARLLSENGHFSVILPVEAEREFRSSAANYRLFPKRIMRVKPNPLKPVKRVLIEFRFEAMLEEETELIIESELHHDYTDEFIGLVKDFYLNL